MDECFICGASESDVPLFEVITKEGIKKICKECLKEEDFPVIKKPSEQQIEKSKEIQNQTLYQRQFKTNSYQDYKNGTSNLNFPLNASGNEFKKEPLQLTIQLEPNLAVQDKRAYDDVVEHFHWIIMRKRRMKKLTKEQFAEKIKEPLQIIEIIEKGLLPSDYLRIFEKIEKFLEIGLLKENARKKLQEKPRYLDFEKRNFNNLTIADLKKMREEQKSMSQSDDEKKYSDFTEREDEKINKKNKENFNEEENSETLSDKEINDILFGS